VTREYIVYTSVYSLICVVDIDPLQSSTYIQKAMSHESWSTTELRFFYLTKRLTFLKPSLLYTIHYSVVNVFQKLLKLGNYVHAYFANIYRHIASIARNNFSECLLFCVKDYDLYIVWVCDFSWLRIMS
jgi:hypothetical protein